MRRRFPASSPVRRSRGFTLAEVLAALLFMAIVIPVAMQGMYAASRAGTLGQRKAAAMRIAERVLDETIVLHQVTTSSGYGTITEGANDYPWTLRSEPWSEDGAMTLVTARVTFAVQGDTYEVAASTLYDASGSATSTGSSLSSL